MDDQKRLISAIGLSAIVLIAWQFFFVPKQPQQNPASQTKTEIKKQGNLSTSNDVGLTNVVAKNSELPATSQLAFGSDTNKITFSNYLEVTDFDNLNTPYRFNDILGVGSPLKFQFKQRNEFKSLPFILSVEGESFIAKNAELGLTFRAEFNDDGLLKFNISSINPVTMRLLFEAGSGSEGSIFNAGQKKEFLIHGKETIRFALDDDDREVAFMSDWVGYDYNYHLFSVVFNEKQSLQYAVRAQEKSSFFDIKLNQSFSTLDGSLIFTKKNYDYLSSLGSGLKGAIDFGWFGIISIPILRSLQFFYELIPNYGVAIIFLTIFIRMLTFPLSFKSFKSMKKMQKLQPELAKVKERHKDDPQAVQKATMELFKKHGANPIGGCLPMLAQFPIFIAFYNVLRNSVELVEAPFFGWIQDLSMKDPYYVLPVLMAVSMFAQQKLMPTATADPTQQKVMMFMPLIFGFMMSELPSGLTLYIFISTIFGIIQQMFVYRAISD